MTAIREWPMPAWLADVPDVERESARARFLLCLAALYHEPEGKLGPLSESLGFHYNRLATFKYKKEIPTPGMAVKLEELMGRDLFPREIMRPDLFLIKD